MKTNVMYSLKFIGKKNIENVGFDFCLIYLEFCRKKGYQFPYAIVNSEGVNIC